MTPEASTARAEQISELARQRQKESLGALSMEDATAVATSQIDADAAMPAEAAAPSEEAKKKKKAQP